jgi:anaerobic selenocysteine-containing dehydrogenase
LARETIILPVVARDEEPEATTQESMFNYIRLSDGGPRRHAGPRSEVDVIASIAEGVFGTSRESRVERQEPPPVDWAQLRSTVHIRQAIARIVPGFEKLSDIDGTREEFHIAGRVFHAPKFATPDGRAHLHTHELPELLAKGDGDLRLMTLRSEGQFNTVVYEDEDVYRGVDQRDVILLHPTDLSKFALCDGDRVTVHGPAGAMRGIRATEFANIKPGNAAMYYPEVNAIVGRTVDPQSRTPAFKCVAILIEK